MVLESLLTLKKRRKAWWKAKNDPPRLAICCTDSFVSSMLGGYVTLYNTYVNINCTAAGCTGSNYLASPAENNVRRVATTERWRDPDPCPTYCQVSRYVHNQ